MPSLAIELYDGLVKGKKKSVKGVKNPWFKERRNHKKGWSFVPINWKGWVALILLVGVNVFSANYFNLEVLEAISWNKFGVVFLLSICGDDYI